MGSGGHNRIPKHLKLIRGTYRKDRNPKNEPEPEKLFEAPQPPAYLGKYAKKFWKAQAPKLIEMGVLTEADLPALELCATAYGEYREAYEAVYCRIEDRETGKRRRRTFAEYMIGRNSQTMPEYQTMKASFSTVKALLAEFGMTPVARNRIDLPDATDERDPMEMILDA